MPLNQFERTPPRGPSPGPIQIGPNPSERSRPHAVPRWLPWLALLGGVVLIAFSALLVKWAGLGGVAGPVAAFYRLGIASIVLCPWTALRRSTAGRIPLRGFLLASASGVLFAADLALWCSALLEIPAATASLLANSAPLWVALLSWLVAKELLGHRFWTGMALALIGTTVILGNGLRHLSLSTGCGLALAASLFYGGYIFVAAYARVEMPTAPFMALMSVAGSVGLLILCWSLNLQLTGFGLQTWLILIALGLLTHLCGWFAVSFAQGHISAGPISLVLLSQAPITGVLAGLFFGEGVSWNHLLGGSAVLTGIYWATHRNQTSPSSGKAPHVDMGEPAAAE